MAVEYREDPAGIRAMLASPMVVEALRRVAEKGKERAEAIAPVRTGAYAFGAENAQGARPGVTGGGFQVDAGVRDGRAYARLSNHVRAAPSAGWPEGYMYAEAIEFGNSRVRRQRVLGRAIDSMRI